MKNKKTAFEQYIEEFDKIMKISNNLSFEARFSALEDLKEKTKAKEKEQIGLAYHEGLIDGMNHSPRDYYNETFNTKEK